MVDGSIRGRRSSHPPQKESASTSSSQEGLLGNTALYGVYHNEPIGYDTGPKLQPNDRASGEVMGNREGSKSICAAIEGWYRAWI